MRTLPITTWLTFFICLSTSAATPRARALVLIPGTFNSYLPGSILDGEEAVSYERHPYFSGDIIQTLRKEGFTLLIIGNLEPVADFRLNGKIVAEQVIPWYAKQFPRGGVPITLVGHSAGALYGLAAMELLPRALPVQRLVAVATPLRGAEIAERVLENGWFGQKLQRLLDLTGGIINLRGLSDLTPGRVRQFLGELRLPPDFSIVTVTAAQPLAGPKDSWRDPRVLSLGMSLTAGVIGKPSDGMVSVASATGPEVQLKTTKGAPVPITTAPFKIPLEHTEQILDARIFRALGTANFGFIRDEQIRAFTQIGALCL